MSKRNIEILVGLVVVLGLVALVFVALKAANLSSFNSQDTYAVSARFDDIGGLKARAPVRVAGVVVGRVTAINLDPKTFQGVVSLAIERSYQLPKDSSANIRTAGLLGDQYVGLEPGGEVDNLAPGALITRTQSAVVLEKLIGQFLFNKAAETGADNGKKP